MNKISIKKMPIYCNIALIVTAFITGFSFVLQKTGMTYIGPFTFNTLRCFIGSLSLIPFIHLIDKIINENPDYKAFNKETLKDGIIAGFVLFIALSINQFCMLFALSSKAGFITSLYILFVPLISVFLKQKLKNNIKLSIVIALIGLYLLCDKGGFQFELWDIFLLVSAFFFALHIIVLSFYSKKTSAIRLSIVQFLTVGVLSFPFMLLENPTLREILLSYKDLLLMGILVTAIAYTLQIFGHKATRPATATLILSSEAVFALFWGMIILNEKLTSKEIFGCIIMIFAIVLSQMKFRNYKNEKDRKPKV